MKVFRAWTNDRDCGDYHSEYIMLTEHMNKVTVVVIAVLALVVVIVVLQNTQAVETKLLFATLTLPNAALLFGTLVIGFTIGVLTAGHIVSSAKRPQPDEVSTSNRRGTFKESMQ